MTNDEVVELTICIPTNGRPNCLASCFKSLRENSSVPCKILVLDSTSGEEGAVVKKDYSNVYALYDNVEVIYGEENIAPGAARKLLGENVDTKYVLFLDDDVIVYKNSIEVMKEYHENNDYDIVSGVWEEVPSNRPTGFNYSFGLKNGKPFVLKSAIRWNEMSENDVIEVDEALPSIFMETKLLEEFCFDDRYDFYFDVFDFFMETYKRNMKVVVHGGVRFLHKPLKYSSCSTRQTQNVEKDKEKFIEKWKYEPITLSRDVIGVGELFHRFLYRFIKPK